MLGATVAAMAAAILAAARARRHADTAYTAMLAAGLSSRISQKALKLARARGRCTALLGPLTMLDGQICGCRLDAGHDGAHECGCGSSWSDLPTPDGGNGNA